MYESEFEKNLYQQRRDKLKQIAALGQLSGLTEAEAIYPNSYSASHTIPEVRAAYDALTAEQLECSPAPVEVSISGRIMAIRVQGKAGFAQLQQGDVLFEGIRAHRARPNIRLQIYVRKDDVGENAFALYKLLDLGDHIGVRGHLFRTRTGELTVHVESVAGQPAITFLAKAMLALPDKYHGLEDTELRYRQRYVDLFMNTGVPSRSESAAAPPTTTGTVVPEGAGGFSPLNTSPDDKGALAPGSAALPAAHDAQRESAPPNVREVFVKRAAILRALRTFFDARGYLEVETPMMQQIAGGAAAQPFTTHHNALDIDLFLRIAPELYLKRLVVGGLDRVYEINRNFRNEGISTRHNPEFTMLEFYQAYANYHDLIRLTEELIIFVAKEVNGTTITHFNGHEIDLSKWTKLSMREAIPFFWDSENFGEAPKKLQLESYDALHQFLSVRISEMWPRIDKWKGDPVGFAQELTSGSNDERQKKSKALILAGLKIDLEESGSYGRTVAALFEMMGEQKDNLIQPTIIYDFPLAVSPLSKKKPDEPDWVERFEFYIGGFELGNAFSELNDPDDQRARFEQQMSEKEKGDTEAHQMDEDYVRALGYGLPPTAGEGIGIDRLTMVLTNSKSIRDVILFPLMRPQAKQQTGSEVPHGESTE